MITLFKIRLTGLKSVTFKNILNLYTCIQIKILWVHIPKLMFG